MTNFVNEDYELGFKAGMEYQRLQNIKERKNNDVFLEVFAVLNNDRQKTIGLDRYTALKGCINYTAIKSMKDVTEIGVHWLG